MGLVVPLLPLLQRSNCWAGVELVWFREKFCKHTVEVGKYLLDLIYGHLWEIVSGSMKNVPLWFTVVTHEDRAFYNHLEVGTFPSNFILSSIPGPFIRANEELGCYKEWVDLFKSKGVKFTCFIFQVQDGGAYTLGLDDPPNVIVFCVVHFF